MFITPKTLLCGSNGTRLTLPTGEGAPQGLRGWGVGYMGSGEEFPSGVGRCPRFGFAMLSMARRSRQASQTPINFDALASKYV
ncbi:hypothetical protein CON53_20035 [Bacillus cereus]|nr:hypothetical protein CON53_20035 [Bacillus cereus]PFH90749.1 hypothetical protein COI81_08825 [Bacillus cereus]PFM52815.1 hypothetical protein COJ52_25460 [Bacillus cereus]PGS26375.1 hypothetical protein COC55_12920 [Bacillus cereus]